VLVSLILIVLFLRLDRASLGIDVQSHAFATLVGGLGVKVVAFFLDVLDIGVPSRFQSALDLSGRQILLSGRDADRRYGDTGNDEL